MAEPLLSIRKLQVDYITDRGPVRAIDTVSLDLMPGEILGVAGESGSGKTTLAKAVLRILETPAVISGGEVLFEGRDLLKLDEDQLRDLRWKRMSMVFQSAMDALSPVLSVGEQITDTLVAHTEMDKAAANRRAAELLDMVGIPSTRLGSYAHQLSGGMRQRVGIALALALKPSLIILDEPTTALDVIVEREILSEIRALQRELGFSVLFITHDLARMLEFSDRVAVFYAARLAEVGPAQELVDSPRHPYTQALLRAFPRLHGDIHAPQSIPGSPPSLMNPPQGCRFHPRCTSTIASCMDKVPVERTLAPGHVVRCHVAEG